MSKHTMWNCGLLPGELWMEILLKLPVKSIICASCVCKPWWSIIRSPIFITTHLSNTEKLTLFRHYDHRREYYTTFGPSGIVMKEIEFPFTATIRYFRVAGSCDGLVCLSDHPYKKLVVTIWNPTIRNHVVLPESLIDLDKDIFFVFVGFGVAGNVYKAVRLVYRRTSTLTGRGYVAPPQAEVFSLGTRKWRRLTRASDVKVCVEESTWSPIFFKGVLHWIAFEPTGNNTKRNSILTFHVGDEDFGEIMLPQEMESGFLDEMILSLAIIGESLGAMKFDDETLNHKYDVWIMKIYGVTESWTYLYRIDTERIRGVVGFWESGEALLVVHNDKLVTYNAKTQRIKDVQGSGGIRTLYMGDYKESLLLLGVESSLEKASGGVKAIAA